jgi:hypothetical protein
MPEGVAIGWLLCALVVGVAVGIPIGAICLRAAVALYNWQAGGASSPSSVPELASGKAMWISLDIFLAQIIVGVLIAGYSAALGRGVDLVAKLIYVSISFLVMAGILSKRLPTTFGRAISVTLCDMLVTLLVGGALVCIAIIVFGFFLTLRA